MTIEFDHAFICCDPNAPEAEALLALGLVEGSPNTHPGQGTANRRFFFHGGYLELLWVDNAAEAQSAVASRTRLWQRWSRRTRDACPFGLCFSPTGEGVPPAPFASWRYEPGYLPQGKAIHFAEGLSLQEPELFYLGWRNAGKALASQPREHRVPLGRLEAVSIGLPGTEPASEPLLSAASLGLVSIHRSDSFELRMAFHSDHDVTLDLRETLGLVIAGCGTSSTPAQGVK